MFKLNFSISPSQTRLRSVEIEKPYAFLYFKNHLLHPFHQLPVGTIAFFTHANMRGPMQKRQQLIKRAEAQTQRVLDMSHGKLAHDHSLHT